MGKARSVFSNRNIINAHRNEQKIAAFERRIVSRRTASPSNFGNPHTPKNRSSTGTEFPLGDGIHDLGTANKRYQRVYTTSVRIDNSNSIDFSTAQGIEYNVGAGTLRHEFKVDGTSIMLVQSDRIDVRQDILMGGLSIDIGADGTEFNNLYVISANIHNSTAEAKLTLKNTEAGANNNLITRILMQGKDSGGTNTSYGAIDLYIRDTTNGTEDSEMHFTVLNSGTAIDGMRLDGEDKELKLNAGWRMRSSGATEIGFQVGNEALTVGSEGSMILPYISSTTNAPSDATVDGWFGDVNGAIGIQYYSSGPNHRIWIRSNGTWVKAFAT